MKRFLGVFMLLGGLVVAAMGQTNIEITSFQGNGVVTWTSDATNVSHRIEWASTLDGPWSDSWNGLNAISADTNLEMSASVPMFYRVVDCTHEYMVIDLSEGPTATNYPVSYLPGVPVAGWQDEYKTKKMVLRRIPAGTFVMGSPTNELGRDSDETQHPVTLTKDFYVGVFEVTQEQWFQVMGVWPSWFTNAIYRNTRPVEVVSYNDIRGTVAGTNWPANGSVDTNSFMGLLRAKTGQDFDLPTEAQWEYACRAGTTNALNSDCNLTNTSSDTQMDVLGRYWYNGGSEYSSTGDTSVGSAKVGSYLPNAWGLYDMHGNVWEWCLDWYESAPAGGVDPSGPILGSRRVARGGGWSNYGAWFFRSACRSYANPGNRYDLLGFRVSLPPGQ